MTQTVYFGTYTRRSSEGIYKADFDTSTGELANLTLIAKEPNPTYLAFDKQQNILSELNTVREALQPLIKRDSYSITLWPKVLLYAM